MDTSDNFRPLICLSLKQVADISHSCSEGGEVLDRRKAEGFLLFALVEDGYPTFGTSRGSRGLATEGEARVDLCFETH